MYISFWIFSSISLFFTCLPVPETSLIMNSILFLKWWPQKSNLFCLMLLFFFWNVLSLFHSFENKQNRWKRCDFPPFWPFCACLRPNIPLPKIQVLYLFSSSLIGKTFLDINKKKFKKILRSFDRYWENSLNKLVCSNESMSRPLQKKNTGTIWR